MHTVKSVLTILFGLIFICSCSTKKRVTAEVSQKIVESQFESNRVPRTDTLLYNLLSQYPQYFDSLLKNIQTWQIQIIYTQINRDKVNSPLFTNYHFNVDTSLYFYPASTVKLPVAVLALQRLNELKIKNLNKNSMMITGDSIKGLTPVYTDSSNYNSVPSISHYIKKILLVSDNDAFNRLYEFLGQEYIHTNLQKMGYTSAQIRHRLSVSMTDELNKTANPISFFDSSSQLLYKLPLRKSAVDYQKRSDFFGKGYYSNGKLISQPFDFSMKNRLSLPDLHIMIKSLMFPESLPKNQQFLLANEDYDFLRKYMSMYPKESMVPFYGNKYNDAYVKFLLYGAEDPVRKNVRIFNKVGDAYGFLIDAAYVADFENGIEYMLSAVIHCNPDGIYNDDKYEYDKVGFPFMKYLGEVIHQFELKRHRAHKPDLSAFQFKYDK